MLYIYVDNSSPTLEVGVFLLGFDKRFIEGKCRLWN